MPDGFGAQCRRAQIGMTHIAREVGARDAGTGGQRQGRHDDEERLEGCSHGLLLDEMRIVVGKLC